MYVLTYYDIFCQFFLTAQYRIYLKQVILLENGFFFKSIEKYLIDYAITYIKIIPVLVILQHSALKQWGIAP